MPFVNVKTLKGALSEAQKKELHARIADVLVEIEGRGNPAFRPYVMIMIDELEPGNASLGGKPGSREFVASLAG